MQHKNEGKFYGTVTVSERGQIAIPAEARRDFQIDVGDKLLVMGDPMGKGVGLIKASVLKQTLDHMMDMFRQISNTTE